MLAAMVCSTTPIDSVSWSRKVWWISLKRENEASSITAFTWPSNSTGRMTMFTGAPEPSEELMRM
ncbi:hypothetical protein D3C83_233370 [compost metagenome]